LIICKSVNSSCFSFALDLLPNADLIFVLWSFLFVFPDQKSREKDLNGLSAAEKSVYLFANVGNKAFQVFRHKEEYLRETVSRVDGRQDCVSVATFATSASTGRPICNLNSPPRLVNQIDVHSQIKWTTIWPVCPSQCLAVWVPKLQQPQAERPKAQGIGQPADAR